MSETATRRLLALALLLAFVVVGASSFLRLGGNGLGCAPWPACYGTAATAQDFNAGATAQAVRLTHRVAASAFLVVALVLVAGGWRRWRPGQRRAAIALLVVTAMLAALGRYTPSALPWVTWANMLGGFALVALLMGLRYPAPGDAAVWPSAGGVVLVLVLLQALSGALLSVRLAGADCAPACSAPPAGDLAALWNPVQAGTAFEAGGARGAGAALHALHRFGGVALVLVALAWCGVRARAGSKSARLALATGAAFALGFFLAERPEPALGAAHAMVAALVLGACAPMLRFGAARQPAAQAAGTPRGTDHRRGYA
jgi:cytochrome c oxidase assembly protein subunit 15